MSAITDATTQELIEELKTRHGVKQYTVGPYQPYVLKRKYVTGQLRVEHIEGTAIVVSASLDQPQCSSSTHS